MNFTQQYGKNRQSCQQYKFYYAVWQLLPYYYREFPSKILSVYKKLRILIKDFVNFIIIKLTSNFHSCLFWFFSFQRKKNESRSESCGEPGI